MNKIESTSREAYQYICESGKLHLSNSEYEPVDACPTKGMFAVLNRRVSAEGQIALVFGGAFHAAMEAHLRGEPLGAQLQQAMDFARANDMSRFEDQKRNFGSLETLVRMYNADYEMRAKQFKPVQLADDIAVEKTFELPLGKVCVYDLNDRLVDIEVYVRGKLDLLTEWTDGNIWVVDHKTTSVMGPQFTADKMRGSQFLIYVMGARTLVGVDEVRGCVVNVAAIRSKTFEFQTFDLPFPQWQIDEFKQNFVDRVQSWLFEIGRTLRDPKVGVATNRTACVTKYGKCAYFDVCQAMPAMRSALLYDDTLFKAETHTEETYGRQA